METNAKKAKEFFTNGFNCAQSVLSVFCEKYGLSSATAAKMSCGMGSGFRFGQICGAASGAVLVVGLKCGQTVTGDKEAKQLCYEKTEEFLKLFRERNESFICREILGCDISTKEGSELARAQFTTTCVRMIESAVCLLEELEY